MNEQPAVLKEQRGGLVILRLNQPDRMNALSADIKDGLRQHIPEIFADPSARCLMITGNGNAFCAGGDVRNMVGNQPPAVVRKRLADSHEGWVRHLLQGEKPVITAVNGPAVGAGFALAMLGDIILATKSAYFLAGFTNVGAVADMGLAATLPRAVGVPLAKEILFTRRKVKSDWAQAIGMVNKVFEDEDFETQSLSFAEELADGPTVGIGLTKTLISLGYELDMGSLLLQEGLAQAYAFSSEDREEGAAAFLEKRAPRFKGS